MSAVDNQKLFLNTICALKKFFAARHRIELTRNEAERGVAGAGELNDGKLFLAPVPAQPCSIFVYVPANHHTDGRFIDIEAVEHWPDHRPLAGLGDLAEGRGASAKHRWQGATPCGCDQNSNGRPKRGVQPPG